MKALGKLQPDHRVRLQWVAWIGVAALALAVRLVAGPRTIDDAYITFRYARNLAEGLGFVYNPGEHVLGTTTPLYTLLLALTWIVGLHDLPWVALVLNALADAGTALLLLALGQRFLPESYRDWTALGLACLWAVSPMSVTFAIGGMETSVVILLLTAAFVSYAAGQSRWSMGLLALAVLTRPDAMIAAPLLWADLLRRAWRERRWPWAEAALFLGLLLPWLLFASYTFGSPIPQSVQAKVGAYHLGATDALVRLLQHYSTPFFEHEVAGRFWPAIGLPLYLALFLLGGLVLLRREFRLWPFLAYPLVYAIVFAASNPLIFRWYLAPPLPAYFTGIAAGGGALLGRLPGRAGKATVAGLLAVWLGLSLNAYTLHPDHGPPHPSPEMAWFKLELLYQDAAELVRPRLAPGDVVAAGDIGALGWGTGAPILDTVGLVSPEALPYYPLPPEQVVTNYAMPAELVRQLQPAYVVTLEVYVRNTLLPTAWFDEQYELLHTLETDIYGSDGMLIFARVTGT
jgi:hypothetical protein